MNQVPPQIPTGPAPKRDPAVPVLAGVLALAALPATGWGSMAWLPGGARAYYPLALSICALFFLAVAPNRDRGGALRPLALLLAASPFLCLGIIEGGFSPRGMWIPAAGWLALFLLATSLGWAQAHRAAVAAFVVVLIGGGAVLAATDLPLLSGGWRPVSDPLGPDAQEAAGDGHADLGRRGLRKGAAVRLEDGTRPALGQGPGPWWVRSAGEARPGPRPVVLVLDGASRPGTAKSGEPATLVHGSETEFSDPLDLDPFDVVVVRTQAWTEEDPQARLKARALAGFVRAGGLLIGPAPDRDWPPHLGRQLRAVGRGGLAGVASARTLGAGRVMRAASQVDINDAFRDRLWVPEVDVALGAAGSLTTSPAVLGRWRDRPERRRPQGILLLVYAGVLAAFTRLLRGGGPQVLGVLLAAGLVSAGVAWASPNDPEFRVAGIALDVGGPGGRRVEAVAISAGPGGYVGRVRWRGGGVVWVEGAGITSDGRVRVKPGGTAWIARESAGQGAGSGEPEERRAGFLLGFFLGRVEARRIRLGRLAALPVQVEGAGPVGAFTAVYQEPVD